MLYNIFSRKNTTFFLKKDGNIVKYDFNNFKRVQ